MDFATETHVSTDGQACLETATLHHNGHAYAASGAFVSDDCVVGYLAKDARQCLRGLADDLASEFQRSNERFDRERFMRACGLETEHDATESLDVQLQPESFDRGPITVRRVA